jgi:hypothetical protein
MTWKFADHNFTTYLDGSHAKTFPAASKSKDSVQAGGIWIIGQDQDNFGMYILELR